MRFIKQVIRGAGYLEGFGNHPGVDMVVIMLLVCGLAGVEKGGLTGFLGGMAIGAIFILPFFIAGCVSRANACDEKQAQLLNKIKNSHDKI
jgi:hypothetical protein